MANDEQKQALKYLKKKFGTKTACELNIIVEKLAKIIRKESQMESTSNYKSELSAEAPFEAEQLLKNGNKESI
jgi:hypothetical protein